MTYNFDPILRRCAEKKRRRKWRRSFLGEKDTPSFFCYFSNNLAHPTFFGGGGGRGGRTFWTLQNLEKQNLEKFRNFFVGPEQEEEMGVCVCANFSFFYVFVFGRVGSGLGRIGLSWEEGGVGGGGGP